MEKIIPDEDLEKLKSVFNDEEIEPFNIVSISFSISLFFLFKSKTPLSPFREAEPYFIS